MRILFEINTDWHFRKNIDEKQNVFIDNTQLVDLPHTWNGIDGQDGGNDYFRGKCCYSKYIQRTEFPAGEWYFLEVNGANSSADVYLNEVHLAHHDGGYSTWRVDLTETLRDRNLLTIMVDNSSNEMVSQNKEDKTGKSIVVMANQKARLK